VSVSDTVTTLMISTVHTFQFSHLQLYAGGPNNNEAIEYSNFVTSPVVLANALVHRELCIMSPRCMQRISTFTAARGDKSTSRRQHPQNRKYIAYCIVAREGLSHAEVTYTENVLKYGHVVFKISERTDRQTDRHTDIPAWYYFATLPGSKQY